ncbi:hypothetical protein [Janibacter anophelis]|uniref:hypothetical protein n=1 Tax=Janibacter anophelis TaxID=319054 RepID=UPI000DEEC0AE|nr:hypothetical protein [Janibacter anophelis]
MDKQLKSGTVRSLAAKLDDLADDLTADEAAVLTGLLGLASATLEGSHDTAKGAPEDRLITRPDGPLPRPSDMLADAFRTSPDARPAIFDPAGPVSDSVGVGWLCVSWSKDYNIEMVQPDDLVTPVDVPQLGLKIQGLSRIQR